MHIARQASCMMSDVIALGTQIRLFSKHTPVSNVLSDSSEGFVEGGDWSVCAGLGGGCGLVYRFFVWVCLADKTVFFAGFCLSFSRSGHVLAPVWPSGSSHRRHGVTLILLSCFTTIASRCFAGLLLLLLLLLLTSLLTGNSCP